MKIAFRELEEVTIPHLNGGEGAVSAKMNIYNGDKIMPSRIPAGGSIGLHRHDTSYEINYVLSGTGQAVCDGAKEALAAGDCHLCPKGSAHSIVNTGDDDLVLFTVVVEK